MTQNRDSIPADRRERNPLITPEACQALCDLLQHPAAPAWNYEVGDRVEEEDLAAVAAMRERLRAPRAPGTGRPPAAILAWVERWRDSVDWFRDQVPATGLEQAWAEIPCLTREDLATRLPEFVPHDADLERLIVYDTSGTTGHALDVPHHPRAMAQNHPLMEYVLSRHGVTPEFKPGRVACINVGAQRDTVVFATIFSVWNQAGFVKVNLHPHVWSPEAARRFFRELEPQFLTGDPLGFAEMLAWGIECRPRALLSTAVALTPQWRARLEAHYGCPVIDTSATTETGPIAYAGPENEGMHILPPDLYVEIVDPAGRPVPEGERGEICVTGGRNPYLPLLRYRTGDFARLVWSEPSVADPAPRLMDLEARQPVSFRAADGSPVNPVDVGRVIRRWVFIQHEFVQRADRSIELRLRPAPGLPLPAETIREALAVLFGAVPGVHVEIDENLGREAKPVPFRCEA